MGVGDDHVQGCGCDSGQGGWVVRVRGVTGGGGDGWG